ncbi:MAG: hypothetical protein IK031_07305, partial [Bacteroidales bacterium]|nr:hypothetical protein [Bacteroidales bacterium]
PSCRGAFSFMQRCVFLHAEVRFSSCRGAFFFMQRCFSLHAEVLFSVILRRAKPDEESNLI